MEIFSAGGQEYLVVRFDTQHYTNINLWELGKYKVTFTDEEGTAYLKDNPECGILILEEAEADEFFRKPLLKDVDAFRKKNYLINHVYLFYQGTGQDDYIDAYLQRVPPYVTLIQSHTAPYNLIHNWTRSYSENHSLLEFNLKFYNKQYALTDLKLDKKFLCYAGKPRVPRLMIFKMLMDNNFGENSYYSFGAEYIKRFKRYMSEDQYKHILSQDGFEEYKGRLEIDFLPSRRPTLTKQEIKDFRDMHSFLPARVLPNLKEEDYYYDPYFILPDPAVYKRIFLDLVLETFNHRGVVQEAIYYNINFFTEKIFKPNLALRPYMVLGNRNYLRDLKRLFGFKSFDKYWDESYDEKHDVRKSVKVIEDNMRYLNSRSLPQLQNKLGDMQEILVHNNIKAFEYLNGGEAWKKVMKKWLAGDVPSWTGRQQFSPI